MSQRRKILRLARQLQADYGNDFIGWVRKFIAFDGLQLSDLTEQQKEISTALVEHKNLAVSAGGGIGKTANAALLILWFLSTHPLSKVPTTAPSGKQLNDILWSELDLWLKRCSLGKMFISRKNKLFVKGFKEWYAVARTVPKDSRDLNDTLAGFHAPHLFILVDEASGVPDAVFTALDGAMTQENSYILLISNPVSTAGYYYDTISDPEGKGKGFKVLHFDSRDSPLVAKNYEERIISRYGKDSAMYRAKVLGLPITASGSVVVTPQKYDEITAANRLASIGSVTLAVDVAGSGEDYAVFCHRVGNSIVRWDEVPLSDTTFLIDETVRIWENLYKAKDFKCIVDANGIGAGVYDGLAKLNYFKTIGYIGQEKSTYPTMYKNKRAEAYYTLHKEFEYLHFPVKPPERLKKELVNTRFDFSEGPIAVEDKKKLKKRLGFSPDYADALALTSIVGNYTLQTINPKINAGNKNALNRLLNRKRGHKYGRFSKFVC